MEKSKHENRGFKFAKASQRLNFASTVSLGPGAYDVFLADNYLHNNDSGNGPAVMTLAPCVRLTDIVIKEETKKGIPGPGYYDIKEESQKMKKGRITFGGK